MKATTVSFTDGPFVVSAGRYYVVDPCYVFGADDDLWSRLCSYFFPDVAPGRSCFVMRVDGYDVWVGSTAFGDGTYAVRTSKDVGTVGVDAGCLCLVPVELADKWGDSGSKSGHLVEIHSSSDLKYSKGNWSIGFDCEVITGRYADDDYDDYDDDDYCYDEDLREFMDE